VTSNRPGRVGRGRGRPGWPGPVGVLGARADATPPKGPNMSVTSRLSSSINSAALSRAVALGTFRGRSYDPKP
jgi:hypothetical protein